MTGCGKCNERMPPGGDFVSCSGCNKGFHYKCSGISERTNKAKSAEAKKKWRCPHFCRGDASSSADDSPQSKDDQVASDEVATITDIMNTLIEVKSQLTTLTTTVDFLVHKYDEFFKELAEEKKLNKERRVTLEILKQENQALHKENEEIKEKLNSLDQYSRNRDV